MADIESSDIKELQKAVTRYQNELEHSKVTVYRGRLLKKIQSEIAKIRENGVDPDEEKELQKLEELLTETRADHKANLASRYREEFLAKAGSIPSIITALPKGVALAVKKVGNAISSLKEAKTNKEKIFGAIEVLKQSGLLVATPFIFTGKFIAKHWFLTLAFLTYLYNVPGYLYDKIKTVIGQNVKSDANSVLDAITPDWIYKHETQVRTSLGEEIKKDFSNPERVRQFHKDAWNRFKSLPSDIKNLYLSVRNNIDSIRNFFGSGKDVMTEEVRDALGQAEQKLSSISFSDPDCAEQLADLAVELNGLNASVRGAAETIASSGVALS